jgi:predicted enzyme related to lactoylglutathione lyase
MITKMSHVSIYVKNQAEALEFYRDRLGFEVRNDFSMDTGFRWLTVGPADQPDLELVLMEINPGPPLDEESARMMSALLEKGALGAGVFETENCQATYETLRSRGVEFLQPPKEQPYGIEALFKDNSGNWFSLTQRYAGNF